MKSYIRTLIESVALVMLCVAVYTSFVLHKRSKDLEDKVTELAVSLISTETEIRKLKQDITIINNIVYDGEFIKR